MVLWQSLRKGINIDVSSWKRNTLKIMHSAVAIWCRKTSLGLGKCWEKYYAFIFYPSLGISWCWRKDLGKRDLWAGATTVLRQGKFQTLRYHTALEKVEAHVPPSSWVL